MATDVYYNPHGVPVDEPDVFHQLTVDAKGETKRTGTLRLSVVHRQKYVPPADVPPAEPPAPARRVSRQVEAWLADLAAKKRKPDEVVEIVLSLRTNIRVPLLPPLGPGENRDGPTRRRAIIRDVETARSADQTKVLIGLPFEATRNLWLGNAVVGRARLGDIAQLLESDAVQYLEPARGNRPAPSDGIPGNDAVQARAQLLSDVYTSPPSSDFEWIGLFDSGVRRTHVLLNNPARIDWWRDCVNGGPEGNQAHLPGFNPGDVLNHGTSSAALLSGTAALGDAYRGLTPVRVDSWRVYDPGVPGGFADPTVVTAAMAAGVAGYEDCLVVNVQSTEDYGSNLARGANDAFDAGAIVIAPNGNLPNAGPRSVNCPASAHKVLGVGAFDVVTHTTDSEQLQGPTGDQRIKPDIQAPAGVETASNASDNALQVFPHTSCAAPVAGGVAILCYRWLRAAGWREKGLVYAYMILYGQRPTVPNNVEGAGPLRMLVNAGVGHGRFTIAQGQSVVLPVDIGANRREFGVAIWWPESPLTAVHNRIDLALTAPNGFVTRRNLAYTVFQKIHVGGVLAVGRWTVTIGGNAIASGSQDVYLAVGVGM